MKTLGALSIALLAACGRGAPPPEATAFQKELQERVIQARPGDTIIASLPARPPEVQPDA